MIPPFFDDTNMENTPKTPKSSYSLEQHFEIWNDLTGDRIEIGEDRDGLNLVEIRHVSSNGEKGEGVIMCAKSAELLVNALQRLLSQKTDWA